MLTHNHVDHVTSLREIVESGVKVRRLIEHGMRGGYEGGDRDVDWMVDEIGKGNISAKLIDVDDALILDQKGYTDSDIDPFRCANKDPLIRLLSADLATNPGWPWNNYGDKNNHSIVLRIDFGLASFLFTGDLEDPAIDTMLDFYLGSGMLDIDVYQVGHHGSDHGNTPEFMEAMTPQIAVLSMSNVADKREHTAYRYGHPTRRTIGELIDGSSGGVSRQRLPKNVSIGRGRKKFFTRTMRHAVYATGWDGTVVIVASADGSLYLGDPD